MPLASTAPQDLAPSSPTFTTDGYTHSRDGTRLHYYTLGEGAPALVCCDGLGCDGYVWKYIAEEFSPAHQVVRFHYRGHGKSDPPADRSHLHIADLVDDVACVMDQNGVEKGVLLGHSLGVQVILEFHRRYPERVQGLVPTCGTYGRVVDTFRDNPMSRHAFGLLNHLVHRFPGAAQRVWSIFGTDLAYTVATHTEVNGDLLKREDFQPYLKHMSKMDVKLFFDLASDAAENDNLAHLSEIDVPTLIIAGERDGFTPEWLSHVMHARIPGSELLMVPGGTHTAPIEVPDLVDLRLKRWLDERVRPTLA